MQVRLGLLVVGLAASPFAAAQADIRPALWNMSVEFSVPADPAFKQPAISRPQCLAAADARDPSRLLAEVSVPGATGCAISGKAGSSGHLEFDVKCEGIFDGFYFFDLQSGKLDPIQLVHAGQPRTRLNDGKCDRSGRFFAGGMDDKEELRICGLWRLDPDLSVTLVDDGIICSNGPCWSPDDKTFYFADSFQGEIWAYDYDLATGTPANKRVFASLENDAGVADGSTVDAEGCVWNAQLISGDLVRYAPDGSVERRIGMPVRNITSVVFGGDKLDEIYVTSMARVKHPAAHDRFAKEAKPQFLAGSLFRISGLGIRGVPEPRFAG